MARIAPTTINILDADDTIVGTHTVMNNGTRMVACDDTELHAAIIAAPGHGRIVFGVNRAYNVSTMCACCKYTMDAIDGYVTIMGGRTVVACINRCGDHNRPCVSLG